MITFIVAPPTVPQVDALAAAGIQHPLAREVVDALREHGSMPVPLWRVIDRLASARNPDSRANRRCLRLRFLGALRELARAKIVHRHVGLISLKNFAFTPTRRSRARLPRSVARLASQTGGSGLTPTTANITSNRQQTPERELLSRTEVTPTSTDDIKSAPPTATEISQAASALARRPRKVARPWTGYLNGKQLRRRSLVRVPSGEILEVYAAVRGKILVLLPDEPRYGDRVFDRYEADEVERVKLPEAQILGATAPRPGSRPRGRPQRQPSRLVTDQPD